MLKPILFNTPMVQAILEGRKTQTRRLIKNAPVLYEVGDPDRLTFETRLGRYIARFTWNGIAIGGFDLPSPYKPGDILYVRETWKNAMGDGAGGGYGLFDTYVYKADGKAKDDYPIDRLMVEDRWHPSIHMPKEAARIFLGVTDVRVERLKTIKAEDCVAEGAVRKPDYTKRHDLVIHGRYKQEFDRLWDSTIKPADRDRYGWNANPWVWVYEFERISKEEAYEESD